MGRENSPCCVAIRSPLRRLPDDSAKYREHRADLFDQLMQHAHTPRQAFAFSRTHATEVRRDWHEPVVAGSLMAVKDAVMLRGLRAKFTQHRELAELLSATYPAVLVEHTANDTYWADGGGGGGDAGRNMLGRLLMKVRAELRSELF